MFMCKARVTLAHIDRVGSCQCHGRNDVQSVSGGVPRWTAGDDITNPENIPGGVAETRMSVAEVTVRLARREDMPTIHKLIKELAEFEGVPDGPKLTADDLIQDGFESSPAWFFALVAEAGGAVVGYAILNRAYSSWTRRALYLEDLYVLPACRRAGVGQALLREICRIAMAEDVHRIDWHVLEDNASAQAFYARAGARDLRVTEGRAALRLDRTHIERIAAEAATATAQQQK